MTAQNNPPPAAGDPSMEDILASIRRILSEDEPPAPATDSKNEDAGVLVLDPSMMVDEPTHNAPVENAMNEEAQVQPVHAPEPVRAPEPANPTIHAQPPAEARGASLVAPETAAAAASSVGSLVRALTERSTQVHQGGPTIEDLVRDEIRPVLKQWLDTNLPPLVERLVRIEIERVVGRAVP